MIARDTGKTQVRRMLMKRFGLFAAMALLATGCSHDRPHEYGEERPPVGELTPGDKGLQSKDVVEASDRMAMDLLALPEMNASKDRWLIVVDHIENRTSNARFDLDIFLERLRVNLAKHGKGRVQLIENREKLHQLQSRELEQERDDFGQGPGKAKPGPAGIQPDFGLYGRIMEMPNRGTSYFLCEFSLTDLHSREQVWTNAYEVKVAR
jgi:hypothetical protein